jgi:hypothetical protein
MNEQANNNLYGAETILRYLNGNMNREETRFFELALLDDELLADAVEGYRMMQKSMNDQAILNRLETIKSPAKKVEPRKAKVVQIPGFKWVGYAVAASFVVAAGWWLFSISRPDKVLPDEAESQTLMVVPAEDNAVESITNETTVSNEEKVQVTEKGKQEPIPGKTNVEKEVPAPSSVKLNDKVSALKEGKAESESKTLPNDVAVAEKLHAEQDTRTRRMLPASVQNAMQYRFTWDFSDSLKVSPKSGWNAYRKFLTGQFTPLAPLETPAKAILTIDVTGKVTEVIIEAPLTDEEKNKLEKAIKTGPEWMNHTRTKQQTTIQWQ